MRPVTNLESIRSPLTLMAGLFHLLVTHRIYSPLHTCQPHFTAFTAFRRARHTAFTILCIPANPILWRSLPSVMPVRHTALTVLCIHVNPIKWYSKKLCIPVIPRTQHSQLSVYLSCLSHSNHKPLYTCYIRHTAITDLCITVIPGTCTALCTLVIPVTQQAQPSVYLLYPAHVQLSVYLSYPAHSKLSVYLLYQRHMYDLLYTGHTRHTVYKALCIYYIYLRLQ